MSSYGVSITNDKNKEVFKLTTRMLNVVGRERFIFPSSSSSSKAPISGWRGVNITGTAESNSYGKADRKITIAYSFSSSDQQVFATFSCGVPVKGIKRNGNSSISVYYKTKDLEEFVTAMRLLKLGTKPMSLSVHKDLDSYGTDTIYTDLSIMVF